MPFDHYSYMLRAIWKKQIFNIWKPIEKTKLFNPPSTYNLSPKQVHNLAFSS